MPCLVGTGLSVMSMISPMVIVDVRVDVGITVFILFNGLYCDS